MKAIAAQKVRHVLQHRFGLRPVRQGNATGHEVWRDPQGRTCRPPLRKKDIAYAVLYSLGTEIESKGIASRKAFFTALRAA